LVERSEKEIASAIRKRVERLRDVRNCHQVSVRTIGSRFEVAMHVSLDTNLKFETVHEIASTVEKEVKKILPTARVTVHTEPVGRNKHDISRLVRDVAERTSGSRGVHNIHVQEVDGRTFLDFHLEVAADTTVKAAHEIADQVEGELKKADHTIAGITVHTESASDIVSKESVQATSDIEPYILDTAKGFPEIKGVQGIMIRRAGASLHIAITKCYFRPDITMEQAHAICNKIEKAIRTAYPNVERIDIHEEPYPNP
jgi:divalent metal cation (Fe/Co/Zn/Cd) transporter